MSRHTRPVFIVLENALLTFILHNYLIEYTFCYKVFGVDLEKTIDAVSLLYSLRSLSKQYQLLEEKEELMSCWQLLMVRFFCVYAGIKRPIGSLIHK